MSSTDPRSNPDNFCYRHPDRQSFVLCQRCLRTVCHECQTPMPVGVICPECMAEQQKGQRADNVRRMPKRIARRMGGDRPIVTYAIMAVTIALYLFGLIPGIGNQTQGWLAFNSALLLPGYPFEPWRIVTVVLVHSGIFHVALNMLALWALGRSLEPLLGRWRYLTLYVLSAVGGSVLVALLAPGTTVVGASGAVWGLLGAMLIIGRNLGVNVIPILVLLGINLVFSFLPGAGVSWQAHIGGGLVGLLLGWIFSRTRGIRQQTRQKLMLGGVAVGLLAVIFAVPPVLYT
ncbi:rhomboid family intramembrane serine protease [Microbacterium dauci]|uniref:Rhomboid family intramembrane serine protease n=1 Tax=Microbacterium dauci TaxID=3048008 RepID=A0ABT6ZD21_9MICO|nr:rhomboid family intramembrane serine protease [Microbacterium sp. LX3-4]MDJ1114052.1 rhomboid family intramembrane serine protease [Microbacterium sp. LX3-4]